ncbi:MAG: hypothetical protein IH851_12345 [Armatimonadetes bacterium]|nr:hypothetical protein [Armatimonadota bacterium]
MDAPKGAVWNVLWVGGDMDVDRQDIVTALLGSDAAIAGLLLVFQGYVLSTLSGLGTSASKSIRLPYLAMAWTALVAFIFADLSALAALIWLFGVDSFWIMVYGSGLSFICLIGLSVAATVLSMRVRG